MSVESVGGIGVVPHGVVSPQNAAASRDKFLGLPASVKRQPFDALPREVRDLVLGSSPLPTITSVAIKTMLKEITPTTGKQLPQYMMTALVGA